MINTAHLKNILFFFAILLFFFIPISESGKEIALISLVISSFFIPGFINQLIRVIKEPWCIAVVGLLLLVLFSCFWSPAILHYKLLVMKRYSKFLYLPFLVIAFRYAQVQRQTIHAFLFAMSIVSLFIMLKAYGFVHLKPNTEIDTVFLNHIITSMMMSFAAYLSAYFFIECYRERRGYPVLWTIATLYFSFQVLYFETGRTGHIMFLLLTLLIFIQFFNWKQICLGVIALCVVLIGVYYSSSALKTGLNDAVNNVYRFRHHDKNTSVGYRLQFHQYAYDIFKRHPIFGNGTAGLVSDYYQTNPFPNFKTKLFHPHSEYWLILADYGLVGLVLYLWFLTAFFLKRLTLRTLRPVANGIFLIICVAGLSSSTFFNAGGGLFYIAMLALCLSDEEKNEKI